LRSRNPEEREAAYRQLISDLKILREAPVER